MDENQEQAKKSEVAEKEEKILKFWQKNNIFEKSLEQTKNGKPFVFHDGPPFATGTPHYGHLIASAIKDAIPRYQTMNGRYVERQWGWDTHGLPIEQIVEKELGIKNKKEIEEIGIEKFNNLCREKIFTYVDEWNKFIPRFGRWADMDNPYRTMDTSYMESGWWAFSELYKKKLIYKDYRSMHICPRCETTLAQAEVAEGYKNVKDIAVTAEFELLDPVRTDGSKEPTSNGASESKTYLLAWTTTPWTLLANVALAVGEDVDYVVIEKKDEIGGGVLRFVLAKAKLDDIFGNYEYEIVKELKGKDLIGKSYKPLFDHYTKDKTLKNKENGWKIYSAPFVTSESGTGIVHIAPAFGEDDMELGKKHNLPFVQHIGMDGVIKSEVTELAGLSVKPIDDPQKTDVEILKLLAKKNILFSKEKYEHSYPHCWRCDTPLLNYATSSWFVSVTKIKKELLENAKGINWSPKHIKDGRWNDWLENARDWSISRQRFWANTVPVWENEQSGKKLIIGSIDDLKKHSKKSGNKYFVMRHGEADSNLNGYIDSGSNEDNHLTEGGRVDVLKKAKEFKNIDLIISSDVLRVKESAEIVSKELGVELIYDERIREKDFGEYEGKQVEEYSKLFESLEEKFEKKCPNGENRNDVRKRMGEFIYDIDSAYEDKTILIISHGTPIQLLYSSVEGLNKSQILEKNDYFKNSEVRPLEFYKLPHNPLYELDLHRPYVDEIELIDKNGDIFRRTTDVLDTWFDSASVPFSSYHYPFENKEKVEARIPADFIAEGIDQVSKWFYYQHVFAGGIFEKPVFKNVIVNGIVLTEDGKKMSKRLKNYPNPVNVIDKYGADAVRFYLLSSPLARAEDLSFSENGVGEIYKKLILRLRNTLSFYELYGYEIVGPESGLRKSENVLDRWILARLNQLIDEVTNGMDVYELDKATRPIALFIDDLSTWYIRRSRGRFKANPRQNGVDARSAGGFSGDNIEDKEMALHTTQYVLLTFSKIIAPFMPFIAEDVYKRVKSQKSKVESVHLESWPVESKVKSQKSKVLEEMADVREIVSLGLEARAKAGIKVRQPLSSLKVKSQKLEGRDKLLLLVKDEVNVKEVVFDKNIENEVEIDTEITEDLEREGNMRDLLRYMQDLRKKEDLRTDDIINMHIQTSAEGKELITQFEDIIKKTALIDKIIYEDTADGHSVEVGKNTFVLSVKK